MMTMIFFYLRLMIRGDVTDTTRARCRAAWEDAVTTLFRNGVSRENATYLVAQQFYRGYGKSEGPTRMADYQDLRNSYGNWIPVELMTREERRTLFEKIAA